LVEKTYIIRNTTTGGFGVQIIGPSGTGVIIPNGTTASVFCDGTNFFPATTGSLGNQVINGNLAVTGTTTLTGALSGSTAVFSGAISSVNPTFTGTPTAPTAIAGTSTTQIATTAFVQNVAGALGTMSTQNANAVTITGGSINGTTIGAGTAASIAGTTGNFSGNLASRGSVSGASGIFGAVSGTTGTFSGAVSGTTGTFSGALSAASLAGSAAAGAGATGTWNIAILGNAATSTTVTAATQNSITSIPNLATVGTITSGTWSGSFGAVSGANLTNLNASNLASGTVPSARLSGTYGISISGNAATASNGGVTSVNSLTGAVVTPLVIGQGEYGVNGIINFTVSNSRPAMVFVYFGNGAGGNTFLFSNVEWGMGALTNQRIWFQSGVDFQVAQSGSLLTVIPAGSGTNLQVRVNANNVGGYGAPSSARMMVVQF
jgi:hypothetical protein